MSILRTIKDAFKSEFGKPRKNPWPLCSGCYHRTNPDWLCVACRRCDTCCDQCGTCGRCVLRCRGHEGEK
jgi:hypothetical protein